MRNALRGPEVPLRGGRIAAALAVMLALAACHANLDEAPGPPAEPGYLRILPSETDPAIQEFNAPHCVYLNRAPERSELLLWLPGTQPPGTESPGPGAAGRFCATAAGLGYRVIVLKYPNDEPAAIHRQDADPNAFEDFRLAIIAGGRTPQITVSRTDSIENRLIKLLLYLRRSRPAEEWGRYLTPEGDIRWEAVVVAGQSQGGGHAALIATKHRVARVLCLGAPKDYSRALHGPAAWLQAASATPAGCFFALNHLQDHQGCSPAQQLENLQALHLDALGPPVDVDREGPPYRHSHILTTNYPGTRLTSREAHTTGINPRNEAVFGKVWIYMLTEAAP